MGSPCGVATASGSGYEFGLEAPSSIIEPPGATAQFMVWVRLEHADQPVTAWDLAIGPVDPDACSIIMAMLSEPTRARLWTRDMN